MNYFVSDNNAICLVAKENNVFLGYVFGSYFGYFNKLNIKLIPFLACSVIIKPKILFLKGFFDSIFLKFKALFLKTNDNENVKSKFNSTNTFSLVGIGVDPKSRKQGTGKFLMNSFEDEVKKLNKGYKYLRLTVYKNNTDAKNLYLKSGWLIDEETSYGKSNIFYKEIK